MAKKIFIILFSFIAISLWSVETQLDFSSALGFALQNNSLAAKNPDSSFDNVSSIIDATLTTSGSVFGGSSFAIELAASGSLSASDPVLLSVGELYGTISPYDFIFLTIGRIKKEFGAAYFTNFSNRISPALRSGAGVKRNALPLASLDMIIAEGASIGMLVWFSQDMSWDKASYSLSAHLSYAGFASDIYTYMQESRWPAVGLNLSYGIDWLILYAEGLYKTRSDLSYLTDNSITKKEQNLLSGTVGLNIFYNNLSMGLEWWGQQEGYTASEQKDIYAAIKRVSDSSPQSQAELDFVSSLNYTPLAWGRQYGGIWIGCQNLMGISELSFTAYTAVSFDNPGATIGGRISYWVDELSTLWIDCQWYTGSKESEFKALNPEILNLKIGISISD